MNKELQSYLLGDASIDKWKAIMILSILMAGVMMFSRVRGRDVLSPNTPVKFSMKFFIADSGARILATLISIFLVARVSLVWINPNYVVLFAIFIGLISDQLPVLFGWVKEEGITRIKRIMLKWMGRVEGKMDDMKSDITEIKEKTDKL